MVIISFYFCPLFFVIMIATITVFIVVIIIIQGKDDTKLNKERNGWSQTELDIVVRLSEGFFFLLARWSDRFCPVTL